MPIEPSAFASWMDVIEKYGALGVMTLFLAYQTWRIERMQKEHDDVRQQHTANLLGLIERFATLSEGTRAVLEGTSKAIDKLLDRKAGG